MSFRQTLIRQLTAIIGKRSNISALKLPGPAIIPNPKPPIPIGTSRICRRYVH